MQPVPQYGSSSADQAYEQPPTGLQADVSLAMLPIAVGAPHYADWSPVSEPVYATVFCIFCLFCLPRISRAIESGSLTTPVLMRVLASVFVSRWTSRASLVV